MFYFSCESTTFRQGQNLYEANCANCHGLNAEGFQNLYPGLDSLIANYSDPAEIACFIRYGIDVENQSEWLSRQSMPPNEDLNNVEITNIINYLESKWGSKQFINTNDVEIQLSNCDEK